MSIEEQKQIEQIEKELGIKIVTLYKALRNGICYKADNGNIECGRIEHFVPHMYKQLHLTKLNREKRFAINEYGITWALTKAELEVQNG